MKASRQESYVRRAHHAGAWYDDDEKRLSQTLKKYLSSASLDTDDDNKNTGTKAGIPRGIVSPHAGFDYSGPTAAYAYIALKETLEKHREPITVLVLHPSHHLYLDGCAISNASAIETPIKTISVDDTLRQELLRSNNFSVMDRKIDEVEHSGEMQYPFIAKAMLDTQHSNCQILPIMIGAISTTKEQKYGEKLAPIIARPNIFTVISSDFCHWGNRFNFTFTTRNLPIYKSIQKLDEMGMDHIQMQQPGAFAKYIKKYSNTICGRHPISVWLNAIALNNHSNLETLIVNFVKYDQSSQVTNMSESSVSYASAIARKIQ